MINKSADKENVLLFALLVESTPFGSEGVERPRNQKT